MGNLLVPNQNINHTVNLSLKNFHQRHLVVLLPSLVISCAGHAGGVEDISSSTSCQMVDPKRNAIDCSFIIKVSIQISSTGTVSAPMLPQISPVISERHFHRSPVRCKNNTLHYCGSPISWSTGVRVWSKVSAYLWQTDIDLSNISAFFLHFNLNAINWVWLFQMWKVLINGFCYLW